MWLKISLLANLFVKVGTFSEIRNGISCWYWKITEPLFPELLLRNSWLHCSNGAETRVISFMDSLCAIYWPLNSKIKEKPFHGKWVSMLIFLSFLFFNALDNVPKTRAHCFVVYFFFNDMFGMLFPLLRTGHGALPGQILLNVVMKNK